MCEGDFQVDSFEIICRCVIVEDHFFFRKLGCRFEIGVFQVGQWNVSISCYCFIRPQMDLDLKLAYFKSAD